MTPFPPLPLAGWRHTRDTIQVYAKVVGRIRQAMTPPQQYDCHTSLRVAASGLTTTPILAHGFVFDLLLDFVTHQLRISSSRGDQRAIPLRGQPAERFCTQVIDALAVLGVAPDIDHTEFDDETPGMYDETAVSAMWQAITQIDAVVKQFQATVRGETSPVQFRPQPFDLAMLWLTGRLLPGQNVTDEDAVAEQMTFGFATGNATLPDPYFYATAYPMPANLTERPLPDPAFWQRRGVAGAVLMYEGVQTAVDPTAKLLEFLQAAYEAGRKTMA